MFVSIKSIPGLGYMFFRTREDSSEQKCSICGRPTIFEVSGSEQHFNGKEQESFPCCQHPYCYNELIAQKVLEIYQNELSLVFSDLVEGEENVCL